jgi:hypothetical protein
MNDCIWTNPKAKPRTELVQIENPKNRIWFRWIWMFFFTELFDSVDNSHFRKPNRGIELKFLLNANVHNPITSQTTKLMSLKNISNSIQDFTLQSHFYFISYTLGFLFISLTAGAGKLKLIVSSSVPLTVCKVLYVILELEFFFLDV